MALSDLQLLELAERAQEGRKGDKGEPGVGVRDIRQPSPDRLVVELTNGEIRSFTITIPERGEPGPAGPQGVAGERGPAGRDGAAGAAGRNGRDGADGDPGVSVDSAIVNAQGDLLIGLTDGSIVSAGRVVGPAGATGERGATGLQGAPGRDGAQFLAGEHPPNDAEDGKDGDMWADLSSPQVDVYGPKKGGAWGPRRFFLKQPPATQNIPGRSFLAGGGSGSGGGGGRPAFEIRLEAGVETEVARLSGEQALMLYRVYDSSDLQRWSAGQLNLAATELLDETEFTIAAELYGINGDLDLFWRIERPASNLELVVIYATSPVEATIRGRIVSTV